MHAALGLLVFIFANKCFAQKTVVVIPLGGEEASKYKTIFISSAANYLGNLGGPEGADESCRIEANLQGSKVQGKNFKAWVSTGIADDLSLAGRIFIKSEVPLLRVDGVRLADNHADLIDGVLAAPINVDQFGIQRSGRNVITGVKGDGTFELQNCNNWTSSAPELLGVYGAADSTNASWTSIAPLGCANTASLYCYEQ